MAYSINIKKSFTPLLVVTLLLLLLTACTSAAATLEPQHPPLKVEWTLWPGDYPIAIAKEKGFFEKHGVQVEPVLYETYSETVADLAAGKTDGGIMLISDLLPIAAKAEIKAVLLTDYSAGADQVIAPKEIVTPADLKGKSLGVKLGTFGEMFVLRMLEMHHLTPGDVKLVDIDGEAVLEVMPGQIQAGHTWEPYTTQALEKDYHVIFSSAETPGLLPDFIVFRGAVVKERPEDVRAFVAAWLEAIAYWQANPEESNAIIAKYAGLKPEEISTEGVKILNLEDNLAAFANRSKTDPTSLDYATQLSLDLLIRNGSITTPPNLDQILDSSFLK
jgi:NitT/TauT family transport system substrate-binding protein